MDEKKEKKGEGRRRRDLKVPRKKVGTCSRWYFSRYFNESRLG